ncbi:unnamed protein product [Prorocentrum cordatum]|uniref:4-nitrophenylphosphatase n=1 Tax=Prorocentrum cordatum TaxID=2364126 RepID=A0ABN9PDK7_9DINO|nr:unnamed protein product [Polarella glacialis]
MRDAARRCESIVRHVVPNAAAGATSMEAVESGSPATVADLLRDYDAFLLDCDGTLYHAGDLLPHVPETIGYLRSLGKRVFFVTNTSSRSSEQLQEKLAGMGVDCVADECVPASGSSHGTHMNVRRSTWISWIGRWRRQGGPAPIL